MIQFYTKPYSFEMKKKKLNWVLIKSFKSTQYFQTTLVHYIS